MATKGERSRLQCINTISNGSHCTYREVSRVMSLTGHVNELPC